MKTTETKYAVINIQGQFFRGNGLGSDGITPYFTDNIKDVWFFGTEQGAANYKTQDLEQVVEVEVVTEYKVKLL